VQTRNAVAGSDSSGVSAPLALADRADKIVAELRLLDIEALGERHRAAAESLADRIEIPILIKLVAETQLVQGTAAILLLVGDLKDGSRVRVWLEYLTAARAAFDAPRTVAP